MTKTKLIFKTIALMLVLCLMATVVACDGGDDNKDSSKADSKPDYLVNSSVIDDEDEDDVVSGDNNGIVNNNSTTGGNNNTQTNNPGVNSVVSNAEKVDVDARKEFLDSVPAKFDGKTVKVQVWWEWHDWESDKIADFTKETGITISPIVTGAPNEGNYYTKLNALIMQKSSPDLACVDGANFPGVIAQNYFQPISVARLDLTDPAYDLDLMKQFKGKLYSAVVRSTPVPAELRLLFYNKDMFKKYGVKSPKDLFDAKNWNWDTWIDIAKQMQNKTGEKNQISVDYGGRQIIYSCGEDVIKMNDGVPVNNFKSQKVRQAWQFNSDLGHVYNLIASGAHGQFIEGSASMALASDYNAQKGGYFETNIKDFKWGAVPVPSPKGSETYVPTAVKGYGIPRNAKQPEAAGYFLRYWLDSSFNRPGSQTWTNTEIGDMILHVWSLKKGVNFAHGVMNYGDAGAGMGGNFGSMAGEMSSVTAANIGTVFDKWSGVADTCINQIKAEAVN